MTLDVYIAKLENLLSDIPLSEHLAYIKGWLANFPDEKTKVGLTAFLGLIKFQVSVPPKIKNQVVVLLHGIRTEAVWQNLVATELRKLPNVKVISIGYGWFDAIRFWLPWFRKEPENRIVRELHSIKDLNPESNLVVIAHSFSTYLMSRIIDENRTFKISKLILCGSIIARDYRWDKVVPVERNMMIVNEVGTRDVWPVMARVSSWGYGCSGTMGFQTTWINDRYFNYGHSDFFTVEHVKTYWSPLISDGVVVDSPWNAMRPSPSWIISVAGNVPFIKPIIFCLFLIPIILIVYLWSIFL